MHAEIQRLQRLAGNGAVGGEFTSQHSVAGSGLAHRSSSITVQRWSVEGGWRKGLAKKIPNVTTMLRKDYPGLLRVLSPSQTKQWQACFDDGAQRAAMKAYYKSEVGPLWTSSPKYKSDLDRLDRRSPKITSVTIKVSSLFSDGLDTPPAWDIQANMEFREWAKKQIGENDITVDFAYSDWAKGSAKDPLRTVQFHSKGIIGIDELQRQFAKEYKKNVTHRKMIKDLGEALEKIDWLRISMQAEHSERLGKNKQQPIVKFLAESLGYWSTGELASAPAITIWDRPAALLALSRTAYDGRQIELLIPVLLQAQELTRSATQRFASYEIHVMKGAGSAVKILSGAKWAGTLAAGALTGGTSLVGSAVAAGAYTGLQEGAQQASEVHQGLRSGMAPGELAKQAGTSAVLALVGGSLQAKFTSALRVRVPAGVTNPKMRELLASGAAAGLSSTYTTALQVGIDKALASGEIPKSAEEFGDLVVKNAVTSVIVDAGMRGTNAKIAHEFASMRAGLPRGKLLPAEVPGTSRPGEDGTLKIDAIRRLLFKSGGWSRLRKELQTGTGLGSGLTKVERRSLMEQFQAHRTHFAVESAELFGGRVVRDVADPTKGIEVHFDGPDGPTRSIQAKQYLDKARPNWAQAGVRLVIGSSKPLSKIELAKEHLHFALGHEVGPMTAKFEKIYFQWDSLSPKQRLDQVTAIANEPLVAAGYPPLKPKMIAGGLHGQMNPQTWTLDINRSLLGGSAVEVKRFASLANTAAHEGRHGLQWVRAARLDTSGQIARGFRADVAKILLAGSDKGKALESLAAGSEAEAQARVFYESVWGGGGKHRQSVYDRMALTASKLETIRKQIDALRKSPTWTRAAETNLLTQHHTEHLRHVKAHREYKALPEEADAWRYGGEVGVSISRSLQKRFGQLSRVSQLHSTRMSKAVAKQQAILAGLGGSRVTSGLTGLQLAKYERAMSTYVRELERAKKVRAKSQALWDKVVTDAKPAGGTATKP